MQSRWGELTELALTEVEFSKTDVSLQITEIAKLTASLKAMPDVRREIRAKVSPHTVTLIEALNGVIRDAMDKLKVENRKLVVIADSLDRFGSGGAGDGWQE